MNNGENGNNIITHAIIALKNDIYNAPIVDSEKSALIKLLENMLVYYKNSMALISRKYKSRSNEKMAILQSFMTDVIVKISNSLTGETDVHYFVSMINKELNKKSLKKIIRK